MGLFHQKDNKTATILHFCSTSQKKNSLVVANEGGEKQRTNRRKVKRHGIETPLNWS